MSELLQRAERVVQLCRQHGADDSVASAGNGRSVEFSVRDGKVETVKEAVSRSISVRLYVDGRYSTHSTTDLRDRSLATFVREAVALTRHLEPDPYRKMVDPALYEGRRDVDLELFDPEILTVNRERRLELCFRMNEQLVGKPDVISATSHVTDSHGENAMVSSNGFSGTKRASSLWLGSEVTMDDAGKRPAAAMWGGSRWAEGTPEPEVIAQQALERAQARMKADKGPTRKTVMVVDAAVSRSLVGRFLRPISGGLIQQGQSVFADRFASKVASELLTLTDEPFLVRGFGSRLYDAEGIAAKRRVYFEKGVLTSGLFGTYYARKLDREPTSGSSSNLVMALGTRSRDEMIAELDDGVLVTGWLGGNADTTTGDYSLGARGHLIEKGAITKPVAEMNITGNLLELFSRLREVGNDPWPYATSLVPTLVFDDVQFSGG